MNGTSQSMENPVFLPGPQPYLGTMSMVSRTVSIAASTICAGAADAVELVLGDDAPAEMQAAWAAASPAAAATAAARTADGAAAGQAAATKAAVAAAAAGAAAATATGAAAGAAGADAAVAGSRKQEEAATPAEATLVNRLVAALSGARFDSGDVMGVSLAGTQMLSRCIHWRAAEPRFASGICITLALCIAAVRPRCPCVVCVVEVPTFDIDLQSTLNGWDTNTLQVAGHRVSSCR